MATASMLLILRWQFATSYSSLYRYIPAQQSKTINLPPISIILTISPSLNLSKCSPFALIAFLLNCTPFPIHSILGMSQSVRLTGPMRSNSQALFSVLTNIQALSFVVILLKSIKDIGLPTWWVEMKLKSLSVIWQSQMIFALSEFLSIPSTMNLSLGPMTRWVMHRNCLQFYYISIKGFTQCCLYLKNRMHYLKAMMRRSYLVAQTMATVGVQKWCAHSNSALLTLHILSKPLLLISKSLDSSVLKNILLMLSQSSQEATSDAFDSIARLDFISPFSFFTMGSKQYSQISPLETPISTLFFLLSLLIHKLCTSTYLAFFPQSLVDNIGEGILQCRIVILSKMVSYYEMKDHIITWAQLPQEEMLPVAIQPLLETAKQFIIFWCYSFFIISPDSHQITNSPLSFTTTKLSPIKSMQVLITFSSFQQLIVLTI